MKRVWILSVVLLALALAATPAVAQGKWVRGPVTAIGADTLTVTVKGAETVFKVEPATRLIARGAGTAGREAEKKGQGGLKLADFVKVGQTVEVHFKEAAGAKVATEVRPIAAVVEEASNETSGSSAAGSVVSVAADALVVKVDGKEMKFAVTPQTKVTGPGMSTKTRELQKLGKPSVITEFIKAADWVTVYYAEGGATPAATAVRVIQPALK